MAAYAREEALEGKHMAGTEQKQHCQDFFSHLSCSGRRDGLSYPSDTFMIHEHKSKASGINPELTAATQMREEEKQADSA